MATIQTLNAKPLSIGAAAVYPWKKGWMDLGLRQSKFSDEDGRKEFNLLRQSGPGDSAPLKTRIWVPRNMATFGPDTKDLRAHGLDCPFESKFAPRHAEQARVVAASAELLCKGESFITEAPTGFGKTYVASDVIARVGKKAIVIVNKEELVDQWLEAFKNVLGLSRGHGVGLIRGDTCDVVGHKIVIALVQSIAKFDRYPPGTFSSFGLAVWDEVHRVGADFFSNSCFQIPALLRWGLSATPKRKDGREEVIAAHIGEVKVRSTQAPMGFRVIRQESPWYCPTKPKVDKEGRQVVDPNTKQIVRVPIPHGASSCAHVIRMLVHHHGRNKLIANFVAQCYKKGRKIIVQSDTKEHLEILASLIAPMGVPVPEITFYVGGLTKGQRERAKLGSVLMATYAQTKEATDIPEIDTLVMATPKSDVVQIVGRARRQHEGKQEPVIFDIIDLTSPLFSGYANSRARWYATQGAKVDYVKVSAPSIDKQGKSVTIASSLTR